MKQRQSTKEILTTLKEYLEKNPSIRFTQALFNLGITEFADKDNPEAKNFLLRDFYNDTDDDVLDRVKQSAEI